MNCFIFKTTFYNIHGHSSYLKDEEARLEFLSQLTMFTTQLHISATLVVFKQNSILFPNTMVSVLIQDSAFQGKRPKLNPLQQSSRHP